MDGNLRLPGIAGFYRRQVHLFDFVIGQRNAADGDTVTVNKNVTPQRPVRMGFFAESVCHVGIIQTQRKIEITGRIETVDKIKAVTLQSSASYTSTFACISIHL